MMETVYHISNTYLGKKPLLVPRVPVSAPSSESKTPRICVARSVSGCYLGCCVYDDIFDTAPFHVYRAEVERTIKADKTVEDRERSGERWILQPTRFQHIGKMPRLRFKELRSWHSQAYETRIIREWVEGTFGGLLWRFNAKASSREIGRK